MTDAGKMVEKVAHAICTACGENPDDTGDCEGNEHRWQDYVELAEPAIKAMREPSDAMKLAGVRLRATIVANRLIKPTPAELFSVMIDAALTE